MGFAFQTIFGNGDSKPTARDMEELRELCRPVVEYIQKKYGSPHHRIIIDWSSAIVVQDLRGVGFNPPD